MVWCVKECYFVIFLMIIIEIPLILAKQYRKDYIYNQETDAFYKLHIESLWFSRAKSICNLEGASIMVPKSQRDVSQVHGMFKQYPDMENYVWVGNDGNYHESAEEQPLIDLEEDKNSFELKFSNYLNDCDVMTRDGEVKTFQCYRQLPFVCKVSAQEAFFDNRCKVYGKGYQYFENVGSCYKIPNIPYSWNQAYDECRNEGAHLAVLNSEYERQTVRNVINAAPRINGAQAAFFFFVGIRAEKKADGSPGVFKTVFNQTLEAAGFNQWAPNEPNNVRNNEYCGTIFIQDAMYNDVDCSHLYGFVCESEVKNI